MKSITIKQKEFGYETKRITYSVDNSGTGLWANDKQIIGTCDFSAKTPQELMRKIKPTAEEMEYEHESFKIVRGSAKGWE